MIAIALAVAAQAADAAHALPCYDYYEWRAVYLAAHRAECRLKEAAQSLRIPVPRPYLGTLGRERKQLAEWQHNATSWANSCNKWQHWSEKLLTAAGLQPEGGLHGDEQARRLLGRLVKKGLKYGHR